MNEATRQVYNLHDVLNERLPHFQLLTIRDGPGPRPRESRRWDLYLYEPLSLAETLFCILTHFGSSMDSTTITAKFFIIRISVFFPCAGFWPGENKRRREREPA